MSDEACPSPCFWTADLLDAIWYYGQSIRAVSLVVALSMGTRPKIYAQRYVPAILNA